MSSEEDRNLKKIARRLKKRGVYIRPDMLAYHWNKFLESDYESVDPLKQVIYFCDQIMKEVEKENE